MNAFKNRFQPGVRVNCQFTPLLIYLNHDDYSMIMKCIFWNIIYDDNADDYFCDLGDAISLSEILIAENDPIHLTLSIPKAMLCVMEDNLPLCVLRGSMGLEGTMDGSGFSSKFKLKDLFGTAIS
jgi:hypothetical protein